MQSVSGGAFVKRLVCARVGHADVCAQRSGRRWGLAEGRVWGRTVPAHASASQASPERPGAHTQTPSVAPRLTRPVGERDETCPVSTEGWTRRVHFVREGGGRG